MVGVLQHVLLTSVQSEPSSIISVECKRVDAILKLKIVQALVKAPMNIGYIGLSLLACYSHLYKTFVSLSRTTSFVVGHTQTLANTFYMLSDSFVRSVDPPPCMHGPNIPFLSGSVCDVLQDS